MKIRVYTDGACSGNPGPGGWAMVWNTEQKCEQYSGHNVSTTNNRMELTAVIQCMKKIIKSGNKSDLHEIYSDSAYVVNAINNKWLYRWQENGWRSKQKEEIKNQDLWEVAFKCLRRIEDAGQKIKFIKVKGHSGNTFNELVDKLAKEESIKAQAEAIGK